LAIRAFALALAGLLAASSPAKVVPGGPFLSFIGDIIPAFVCVAVAVFGFASLRSTRGGALAIVCLLILLATALFGSIAKDVILFWFRPYARGTVIGF
jgi:hypothetical protein